MIFFIFYLLMYIYLLIYLLTWVLSLCFIFFFGGVLSYQGLLGFCRYLGLLGFHRHFGLLLNIMDVPSLDHVPWFMCPFHQLQAKNGDKQFLLFPMRSHHIPMRFSKGSSNCSPQDVPNTTSDLLSHMVCPKFNSHVYKMKRWVIPKYISLVMGC